MNKSSRLLSESHFINSVIDCMYALVCTHVKSLSNKICLNYQNNCNYVKIQRSRIIGGTQIITNKRKTHLFDERIHFSMQFSAVLNIFIVKTKLNSTFTNVLRRK